MDAAQQRNVTPGIVQNKPMVFTKMEYLVRDMQDGDTGVPIRSQKLLFIQQIPSAFMGYDLIEWLMERLDIEESAEAIHLANLLCQYGYYFPVGETRSLVVKDDSSLYRFQTPYYWSSQNHSVDATDYAIYLTKRLLRNKQRHGLEDYEAEAHAQLKKGLQHKWEFISMQAEEQVRLSKDLKKGDKIVTDSQERAYWRVYRPPPGYTNCLEEAPVPDRNNMANRVKKKTVESVKMEIDLVKRQLTRTRVKVSQAAESLTSNSEVYTEYDNFLLPTMPSNPWVTDDETYWAINDNWVEVPTEPRVRRWAISFSELVLDPTGIVEFTNYLRKEYCHENIRFWQAVKDLRFGPLGEIKEKVDSIFEEFLKPGAPCEINIDGKTMEETHIQIKEPSRYTYDLASDHVYMLLLKKDCYPRFLRSDLYKNLIANALQPSQKKRFFSFGIPVKKKATAVSSTPIPTSLSLQVNPGQSGSVRRIGSDEFAGAGGLETGISAGLKLDCDQPYSSTEKTPGTEVCPWETGAGNNICPWEESEPPPPKVQNQVALIPKEAQPQPELSPPSELQQPSGSVTRPSPPSNMQHLMHPKLKPDRSKSFEVNTSGGPQRVLPPAPLQVMAPPSHPPSNSKTATATTPEKRSEKARSVDVCPWEEQKDVSQDTLKPTEQHLAERRCSEGGSKVSLQIYEEPMTDECTQLAIKETRHSQKDSNISISISPSPETESKELSKDLKSPLEPDITPLSPSSMYTSSSTTPPASCIGHHPRTPPSAKHHSVRMDFTVRSGHLPPKEVISSEPIGPPTTMALVAFQPSTVSIHKSQVQTYVKQHKEIVPYSDPHVTQSKSTSAKDTRGNFTTQLSSEDTSKAIIPQEELATQHKTHKRKDSRSKSQRQHQQQQQQQSKYQPSHTLPHTSKQQSASIETKPGPSSVNLPLEGVSTKLTSPKKVTDVCPWEDDSLTPTWL